MILHDPEVIEVKAVGFNIDLSRTPDKIGSKAPAMGQHTEEVMLELGYTWECHRLPHLGEWNHNLHHQWQTAVGEDGAMKWSG